MKHALLRFFSLYAVEIRRYLAETRVYFGNYISSMCITGIIVALFVLSAKDVQDNSAWVGFLYWNAASTMLGESVISISSDKQNGTFTQLMLRPTSMLTQITMKMLTWALVNIAIDVVFIVALFALIGAPIGFNPLVLPIALCVAVGVYGLTLIMASLTILYTKTVAFPDLIGYAMMFLGGVIIPVSKLPAPLAVIGRVMPITKGIEMSRSAILGRPVMVVDWVWLIGQSVAFLVVSYFVFSLILRHGRKHGINMRY